MSIIQCNECDVRFERCEADFCFTTDLTEPDSLSMRENLKQASGIEALAEFHLDVQIEFSCPKCGGVAQELSGETCFGVEMG
jgi:hypothetical protein